MKYLRKRQPHSEMNLSLTDYFLNPQFFSDPDILYRARILIITLYAFIGITAVAMAILLISPVAPISRLVGIPVDSAVIVTFTWLLFRLKNEGRYESCSNATITVLLLAISFGIAVSGGITYSPFAQVLVIPPLLAFFFGSVRGGVATTAACAAVAALMIIIEDGGFTFPNTIMPGHVPAAQSWTLLVEFICVTTLIYVYEYTSASLRIERDIEHQKILRLAQTDQLTGLANRRSFDGAVSERIKHYSTLETKPTFALCYLDLDGFKPINDRHGHDVGDQVLRAISIRLRSALSGNDLIGRHGGDEFMILLDGLGTSAAVEAVATRFLKLISEPIETSAGLVSIGGSLGFAVFRTDALDTDLLKKYADMAMYEAKRSKLGWKIFDASSKAL